MAGPINLDSAPAPVTKVEIIPRDDTTNSNSTSSSLLESRCTWDDGHGPISCDYFSIVMRTWSWGWVGDGPRDQFTVKGNNFQKVGYYNCGAANQYQDFTSPLPFVLQIHPGNACHSSVVGAEYDNTWLRYANQQLNTPTDSRCGRVGAADLLMRCIIKQRP